MDDDVELCEEIAKFLRDEGYIVENTSSISAGESLIEKHGFDVVLLDSQMTHLTGIDLLKKIRSKNLNAKVFIMTGRPFIEKLLGEKSVAQLVDDVIKKPFEVNDLLDKIEH